MAVVTASNDSPVRGVGRSVTPAPFVGRAAELAALAGAYAHAREGTFATFCIGGEAGVGKTRLITEFAVRAATGARVLLGGCVLLRGDSLPYAPMVEALRGLVRDIGSDGLQALLGDGLVDLAPLLHCPQPHRELGGAGAGVGQARLLERLLHLLERLGAERPVVLMLEDLHWADRHTLDLFAFLIRNLRQARVLLVATYRTDELPVGHPLRALLVECDRRHGTEHLVLERLAPAELIALMTGVLGTPAPHHVASAVAARSQGNPFFAEELLAATVRGEHTAIPPAVRGSVLLRLEALSGPALALLRLLAVAGDRVRHGLLAVVADVDEGELLGGLRELVEQQLLSAEADEGYRFRHVLVREAVYGELLPGERLALHAAFAHVLSQRPELAGGCGPAAAQLARHWYRAEELLPALPEALAAARAAADVGAYPEAGRHYERVLELWVQDPDATHPVDVDRIEVLQRAAEAAERSAQPERAVELIRQALRDIDAVGQPNRTGLLHERLGRYLAEIGDGPDSLAALERAVELVPPEPPTAQRATVLATFAHRLAFSCRHQDSLSYGQEAITLARRVGAGGAEASARRTVGYTLAVLGRTDAGICELRRARDLAAELGDTEELSWAGELLVDALTRTKGPREAVELALETARRLRRHRQNRPYASYLDCATTGGLLRLGRREQADRLARQALSPDPDSAPLGGPYLARPYRPHLVYGLVQLDCGNLEAAGRHLELARRLTAHLLDGTVLGQLHRGLAELALWQGRLDDARIEVSNGLRRCCDLPTDVGAVDLCLVGIRTEADRALHARALGRQDAAREAARTADELRTRLRRLADSADADTAWGAETAAAAVTGEAELSRLEDRPDPDVWARAFERWEVLDWPQRAAYALWRQAEAQSAAETPRPLFQETLRRAHGRATDLGAAPLLREIDRLVSRVRVPLTPRAEPGDTPPAPVPAQQLGLTGREQEVLRLVALGWTNRRISEALWISEKTASVHVSNILRKLAVARRTDAAGVAHRLGLD